MKKILIFLSVICLVAVSIFAQNKTDFSGDWTLDLGKSKLPEMMRIEGGTMKVTQTDKEITYTTDLKRPPRPDNSGSGVGGQGGVRVSPGGGQGPQTMTFTLDGKETSTQVPMMQGFNATVKLKSKWDGTKLKLSSTRNINTPNGEMSIASKDTWEIVDGGKGLKIKRETDTPNGTQIIDYYYTKQ